MLFHVHFNTKCTFSCTFCWYILLVHFTYILHLHFYVHLVGHLVKLHVNVQIICTFRFFYMYVLLCPLQMYIVNIIFLISFISNILVKNIYVHCTCFLIMYHVQYKLHFYTSFSHYNSRHHFYTTVLVHILRLHLHTTFVSILYVRLTMSIQTDVKKLPDMISFVFALSPFGCSFLINLFAAFIVNLYNFFAQFSELVISLLILDACFSSMR